MAGGARGAVAGEGGGVGEREPAGPGNWTGRRSDSEDGRWFSRRLAEAEGGRRGDPGIIRCFCKGRPSGPGQPTQGR